MMNAEADPILVKKLIGHKIQDITWETYAGDSDWEKNLEPVDLVKYPIESALRNTCYQ